MSRANEPLIRQIVAQIEDTPEHWDQSSWVQHNCNTKFCFAGWALFLTDNIDGHGVPTKKGIKLAAKVAPAEPIGPVGTLFSSREDDNERWYYPYEEAAKEVLGLNWRAADRLFSPYAASPGDWIAGNDIETFKRLILNELGIDVNDGAYEIKPIAA